jgi:hypothetical protein
MSRFTENMNVTNFDSDQDEILNRMHQARTRVPPKPTQPQLNKRFILFDESYDGTQASPLTTGNNIDMFAHINNRRAQSEREVERFNTLGAAEYNKQTYGGKQFQVQLGYNDDGQPNQELMKLCMKKHMENSQITEDAILDGTLETDARFLADGGEFDGAGLLSAIGEIKKRAPTEQMSALSLSSSSASSLSASSLSASSTSSSSAVKEITIKYNEKKLIPLTSNQINKVKIIVEYKDGMQDSAKIAKLHLTKSGYSPDKKTMELEIKGEGRTLTGYSHTYFFQKDAYSNLTLHLTGPGVVEASILLL